MTVQQYSVFYKILPWIFIIVFIRDDVTTTVASAFVPSPTSSSSCFLASSFVPAGGGAAPSSSFCQQQEQQEHYQKRSIWLLYCNENDEDTIEIDTRRSAEILLAQNQQQQQQLQQQNRRTFFHRTATGGVIALLSTNSYSLVANSASTPLPTITMQDQQGKDNRGDTSTTTTPICIIGANGKTGSECVGACLARGIPVVATTRGGVYTGNYANTSDLIDNAICDVTLPNTIMDAIQGSRAVIFAASASKAGGTPAAVDNLGLVNVAKACIDQKIPHLVIVSSGAVTKPESPVYKFLNLFGNIMEEKIKGEDRVRNMYHQKEFPLGSTTGSGTTYTILRPGGLTEESERGVQALELNQGDTKSGRISRTDVASLCVEVTKYPAITGGTTFECYDADTGKPLQTVGISNLLKQKNNMNLGGQNKGASNNLDVYMSGYERRGSTWEELFTGLSKDVDVNVNVDGMVS